MVTDLRIMDEAPTVIVDVRRANLGLQAPPLSTQPVGPQQGDVANAAVSHLLEFITTKRAHPGPLADQHVPRTAPTDGAGERGFNLANFVQEQQGTVADMLEEQLERALDLLIDCRLAGSPGTLADTRRVLFDLYDAGAAGKIQVRERGQLEPAEFHDELRAHRTKSRRQ